MTFNLKNYQQQVLDRLEEFFRLARLQGIPPLMRSLPKRRDENGNKENPYAAPTYKPIFEELKDRPHVCVRVPTAGGKTYLAACTLPLAARYMEKTFPRFCGLCRRMRFAPKPLPCLKIVPILAD